MRESSREAVYQSNPYEVMSRSNCATSNCILCRSILENWLAELDNASATLALVGAQSSAEGHARTPFHLHHLELPVEILPPPSLVRVPTEQLNAHKFVKVAKEGVDVGRGFN